MVGREDPTLLEQGMAVVTVTTGDCAETDSGID